MAEENATTEKRLFVYLGEFASTSGNTRGKVLAFWQEVERQGAGYVLTQNEVALKKISARDAFIGGVFEFTCTLPNAEGLRSYYVTGERAPRFVENWPNPADVDKWRAAQKADEVKRVEEKLRKARKNFDKELAALKPLRDVYRAQATRAGRAAVLSAVIQYLQEGW